MTNDRQLDIAVKMGIIDCQQPRKANNPYDNLAEDLQKDSNLDGTEKVRGHKFAAGELLRDLLNLENSRNLRQSRGKGVVKNLTE